MEEPSGFHKAFHFITTISTVASFFGLVPTCVHVKQRGSTEDISPWTFIVSFSATNLWFQYGALKEDELIMIVNAIGVLCFTSYLAFYVLWSQRRCPIVSMIIVNIALLYGVVAVINMYGKKAQPALGIICVGVQVLAFGAPLAGIRVVIRRRSTDTLPATLICAYLLCSLEWALYGAMTKDAFLFAPNAVGIVLSLIQLSLFLIYPRHVANDFAMK